MKWISTKKRLPKLTEPMIGYNDDNKKVVIKRNYKATVLGYNKTIGVFKAELTKIGWAEISTHSHSRTRQTIPTYWQHLPNLPRKK